MNTEMSFILVQIREHESCWWFSENSERVDNHTLMCTELSLCLRDLCVYVPISEEKQLTQECLIQIDPAMIVKHKFAMSLCYGTANCVIIHCSP